MPSDKPFLNFIIEPALLNRIDDYRFKHRFPTRAATIKWLLDWALSQKPKEHAERARKAAAASAKVRSKKAAKRKQAQKGSSPK